MKTLRKNYLVLVLSIILTLCLSLVFAFSTNAVKAETDVNANLFAMEKGAQAALTKDGLRFRVQMGQNVYDEIVIDDTTNSVKLSVFIGPKENVVSASDYDALVSANKAVEVVFDDEAKIYQQGDYYWANAVLTNLASDKLAEKQMDMEFSAIACVKSNGEIIKTATVEDGLENNARTQYGVLQSAVLSVENEEQGAYDDAELLLGQNSPYKNWFGTEDYPVKVETANAYSVLQAKVAAGLNTQANFNVYNKFDLGTKEYLPENTTFYHYVRYYDNDTTTLLDTVEVKEGESANTSANKEYEELDYANSVVYKNYINNWVTVAGTQSVADLSNITENKSVYAFYARTRIDQTLYAEACAANPDVALFFSERFGFTQLSAGGSGHTYSAANREYHPDMSYGGIQGMTSYTVYNTTGADLRMIFKIKINENFTYNAGDYVKFYVYSDITTNTTTARTLVRCNNTNGIATVCDNYDWSEIVFPVEEFVKTDSNGYTYLSFGAFGTGLTTSDVYKYYISNVVRVPGSEVYRMDDCSSCTHTNETLGSTETWTVGGDVEFVGPIHRYKYTKDHSYIGEVDKHVYCINGRLVYGNMTDADSGFTARAIGFNFANKISGKIYVTAKGFGTNGTPGVRYFTDGQESGTNVWKTFTRVTEPDSNGFAVWEMDFGTTEVAYMRLCGYTEYFGQVIISNISTTNPAA